MSQTPPSYDRGTSPETNTLDVAQQKDELFQAALLSELEKYTSRLTKAEEKDFENTTLTDVKIKILQIQDQQGREKKLINLTRINRFLESIDQWGQVVTIFADGTRFVAFVWGLVKALLQAASTFTESFEVLLDAYGELGQRLPLVKQHRALFQQHPDMRDALKLMYCDVLDFHFKVFRSFFSGPVWKKAFLSFWKDFKPKFGGTLRALEQHRSLIESQAQLHYHQQHHLDHQRIFEVFQSHADLRDKLMTDVKNRSDEDHRKKYTEAQAWLGAPSSLPEHEKACEKRKNYEETGKWLFEKPEVKSWKDEDTPISSILWLNGMPGAGKTVLSSQVIEECQKKQNASTIFFYCVQKDPVKNTFLSILKSLLSQALHQHQDDLLPQCYERLKKNGEAILQAPTQAEKMLESFLEWIVQKEAIVDQQTITQRQYVVVDGLDECEDYEWQKLIEFFQNAVQKFDRTSFGRLRIMFISQHTNQIEKALKTEQSSKIASLVSVCPGDNKADIRIYAQRRVKELQHRFLLDDKASGDIIKETCEGACGMFLYARLVIDNLLKQPNRRYFDEERQRKFPSGITEAYERILVRIRRDSQSIPHRWDMIKQILGWLVCARRHLKWQEIQLAYSIDPDDETIEFENNKLSAHIRDDCGSLIEASPQGLSDEALSSQYVRFVHNTASKCIVQAGFANELLAETSLTTKCLQYLSNQCFNECLSLPHLLSFALSGHYIFQEYAVANWSKHFNVLFQKLVSAREQDAMGRLKNASEHPENIFLGDEVPQLEDGLRRFITTYNTAFLGSYEDILALGIWEKPRYLEENEPFWMDLCAVQLHIQQHSRRPFEARIRVSIEALDKAFERIRSLLEDPGQDPFKFKLTSKESALLQGYYGGNRYKCPKLNCPRFVDGFGDRKSRKKHVDRHDRPFRCDVTECPGELGFKSDHDLQKHLRSFHPTADDEAETFEPLEQPKTETAAKWPCPKCPKRFTRGFHLRNHERTHLNERPFLCTECGKSFTRDYDRKRHEKTVHTMK